MPILGIEEDDIDLAFTSFDCARTAVMLVEDLNFLYRTGHTPHAVLLGFSCLHAPTRLQIFFGDMSQTQKTKASIVMQCSELI